MQRTTVGEIPPGNSIGTERKTKGCTDARRGWTGGWRAANVCAFLGALFFSTIHLEAQSLLDQTPELDLERYYGDRYTRTRGVAGPNAAFPEAARVQVPVTPGNFWEMGATFPVRDALESSESLRLVFWGRSATSAPGTLVVKLQKAGQDSSGYFERAVDIPDNEWREQSVAFDAPQALPLDPGALVVLFFGSRAQTIEIAGLRLERVEPFDLAAIPGVIEAEDYDRLGAGLSYYDSNPANEGHAYRTDQVDLESCQDAGGGYNLGWIQGGEWLQYGVGASTSGVYNMTLRIAGLYPGVMRVSLDGLRLGPDIVIPKTGGWQTWQDVRVAGALIDAGEHTLRLDIVRGGFNLNYLQFDLVSTMQPPSVITDCLDPAVAGSHYQQILSAHGGTPPYAWSVVSGELPDGLALDATGVVAGLPRTIQNAKFRVQVKDAWNVIATRDLGITVMPYSLPIGCYVGAFTPDGQAAFEALAKKPMALELFYIHWPESPNFPAGTCDTILAGGGIPHLTWEPWHAGQANDPTYSLATIIAGDHDAYIRRWAAQIHAWGKPLYLRWGHEMNGYWYPWDGTHNGGAFAEGFGDPQKADGPERYVAAYRHIHDLFLEEGAHNVVWVWCPNVEYDQYDAYSYPEREWNRLEAFYPGDKYVDWVAVDGYNWGSSQSWSTWESFRQVFDRAYAILRALSPDKPIMLGEFASSDVGGDQAQWISDAFAQIRSSFSHIKAVQWFHINKETNWRIDSAAPALKAFQDAVADPYFFSSIVSITNGPLPAARIGQLYSQTLTAMGGTGPYSWSIISGSLPQGLSVEPSGKIAGRPEREGTFGFSIRVADGQSNIWVRHFSLVVLPRQIAPFRVSALLVPGGMVVSFHGESGVTYMLETTDELEGSMWQTHATKTGIGGELVLGPVQVDRVARYFRIRAE